MITYDFSTPMMKQYESIKQEYNDCLLFYRLGDFYEMFLEDAQIAAQVLDITLTSRTRGKDGRIPMAGVPYHAVDSYLHKLVKAGYKVAICEQISEPDKKGIVERDVVRIVTPGTVLDEKALEGKQHNYIACLDILHNSVAVAWADISTGRFQTVQKEQISPLEFVKQLFATIRPSECIVSEQLYHSPAVLTALTQESPLNVTWVQEWNTYSLHAEAALKDHLSIQQLETVGLQQKPLAVRTAAVLLGYLKQTQKQAVRHITTIEYLHDETYVQLDRSSIVNLELFSSLRDNNRQASVLGTIDNTQTAMGGRLLREWLATPLRSKEHIEQRQDAVSFFVEFYPAAIKISTYLKKIIDVERILSRVSLGLGNGRDLVTIASSLTAILEIKEILRQCTLPIVLETYTNSLSDTITTIVDTITQTLVDLPPQTIREGGMIREGLHDEHTKLLRIVRGGKEWIADLEKAERERTGIQSLKVRYNKIFGFYIEVSNANTHLVPESYQRKQTLVNGERYTTEELKEYEVKILTAEEELNTLELSLFQTLVQQVLSHIIVLQQACKTIAAIDCLLGFAITAREQRYTKPTLNTEGTCTITDGRHPVVEALLSNKQFVPNSLRLDRTQKLLIITGPNMAGKSVFIRQIAIIVLLAHIGSFVPAASADIPLIDRLFVRSGASDAITAGLSTFMVEMVETAYILRHATEHSLIIMDEIGRGTSTYDGISIASAIAEYLVTQENPPNTLFATHYHELQELETRYPDAIKNYHMAVIQEQDTPVFLYTLKPGGASASFGIAVGKLAGLPAGVISRAETLLEQLEQHHLYNKQRRNRKTQTPTPMPHPIEQKIKSLAINNLTPLEALQILAQLQQDAVST